jgi:enoyl-CoA hydratase
MIRVEPAEGYSTITIDRPEKRNALDPEHCEGLASAVTERVAAGDRSLVITGVERSFCAGADFGAVAGATFGKTLSSMLQTVTNAPIPIVAAINGFAIGAGVQVSLACDLRIAVDQASFAVPTARLGLAVDPWTIARLAAVAGGGIARRMLLTCTSVSASAAQTAGLVDEIGSLGDAQALAADLASMAPLTLAYNKLAVNHFTMPSLDDPEVAAAFQACWTSDDFGEGLRARREGRPPEFTGA